MTKVDGNHEDKHSLLNIFSFFLRKCQYKVVEMIEFDLPVLI